MLGPGMIAFGIPYALVFAGAMAIAAPRDWRSWAVGAISLTGTVLGIAVAL